jgi:hypothetical protein
MKYKEIVDDIQLQFKSHNESVKTQNPYWILFRILSEINGLRDELLEKVKSKEDVPSWMIEISPAINAVLTNSGGVAGVYDDYKFASFTVPDAYYSTAKIDVIDIVPVMRQKQIILESVGQVMLRVKADDESLKDYFYGFQVDDKIFVYPFLSQAYVYYIPKIFCGSFESVNVESEVSAPDFIVMEARKRVIESVLLQKQIPEDDRADLKDSAGISAKDR